MLFKDQTNPNTRLILSMCVCRKSLATCEERKTPRHQELHQKLKAPLLPSLSTMMADSTRLFFLGAKGWLHLYFLHSDIFSSDCSVYTLNLTWFFFSFNTNEIHSSFFVLKHYKTIHHLNIWDKNNLIRIGVISYHHSLIFF